MKEIILKQIPSDIKGELVGFLAFNYHEPANATKYFFYKGFYFMVCKHNKDWCVCEFTTGLRVEYWHKTIKLAIEKAIEKIDKYCPSEIELKELIDKCIKMEGLQPQALHLSKLAS